MLKKFLTSYILFLLIFLFLLASKSSLSTTLTSSSSSEVSSEAQTTATVPVIMYHGLTTNSSMVNEYFILQDSFEADLKYLKENGYVTVTSKDLIDFVYGEGTLPEKPIVLTFDDGYCNNYNFAHPLLKKYNMKAVVSLIGSACQEASDAEYRAENYCNMTWAQVEALSDSGHWEIGNHTWDLHSLNTGRKGASAKSYEEDSTYQKLLKEDLSQLQSKIKESTGYYPVTFAWPFGAISEAADPVLKELGIKITYTSFDGINTIEKGDPNCLYNLKRQLRTPKTSIDKLINDN